MSSLTAPFTGFGDDQATSIKFRIMRNRDGSIPQWAGAAKVSEHDVANGDNDITQRHGRRAWRVTWELEFDSLAALELMDSMQGRRATLRYLAGMTLTVGGSVVPIDTVPYLVLPGTILMNLTPTVISGGICEATASFKRPYVDSPYLGFVELAADPEEG